MLSHEHGVNACFRLVRATGSSLLMPREGNSDLRHSRRPSWHESLSETIMVAMGGAMAMGAADSECLLAGTSPYSCT